MPLGLDDAHELAWFFRQRRTLDEGSAVDDQQLFRSAVRQFHAPRYRAMYRQLKKEGDALLRTTVSRALSDALARRTGRIKTQELPYAHQHLTPLVGSA